MLGFDLDIWDYLTFLVLTVAGGSFESHPPSVEFRHSA